MKVLSIFWNGVSTAALIVEGEIVACVSEERFSRVKNEDGFPHNAINSVLEAGHLLPQQLDLVVIAGERFDAVSQLTHKLCKFDVKDRLKEQRSYWLPKLYENKEVDYFDLFSEKIDTQQYPGPEQWENAIRFLKGSHSSQEQNVFFQEFRRKAVSDFLGIPSEKIVFSHHHKSHAYYAYYGTPMPKEETLIVTADAWGDDMNASVSYAHGGEIKLLSTSTNFNLGRLYRYMTLLLGMKPDEHEYKVMGLAAYSKVHYYKEPLKVFKDTMRVDGLGFAYNEIPSDWYAYFKEKLEGYRFDNIAGALQQYTSDIMVEWISNGLRQTGAKRLCFGGGLAMNVKASMEIAKIPELNDIFVLPTPSDESLAIGAAYVQIHEWCHKNSLDPSLYIKPMKSAYLGPEATADEIEDVISKAKAAGHDVIYCPDYRSVAQMLSEGKIIGRCVGRSEFGARALGNRSILADPRRIDVIKVINEKIKSRDFWMPFAPAVLEEYESEYFINPKGIRAPYMTLGFETTERAQSDIIAGLHQADFTARPQIVSKSLNKDYHSLIEAFATITGVGSLLNTSFNIHGKPIVQTPFDAYEVYEQTVLDALLLDGVLIKRNNAKV